MRLRSSAAAVFLSVLVPFGAAALPAAESHALLEVAFEYDTEAVRADATTVAPSFAETTSGAVITDGFGDAVAPDDFFISDVKVEARSWVIVGTDVETGIYGGSGVLTASGEVVFEFTNTSAFTQAVAYQGSWSHSAAATKRLPSDVASAGASVVGFEFDELNGWIVAFTEGATVEGDLVEVSASGSGPFGGTIFIEPAGVVEGRVFASATAGVASAPAVPVPPAFALLTLGVVGFGSAAWRRRARRGAG